MRARIPFIAKPELLAHDARMTRHLSVALPLAAALALGGCATAVPPVEVTRFHTNAAPSWAPGTRYAIATAPLDAPGAGVPGAAMPSLEWNSYRTAVDQQLQRQGLVAAGSNERAPLLVRISFDRSEQLAEARRSPVSLSAIGPYGRWVTRPCAASFCTISVTLDGASPSSVASCDGVMRSVCHSVWW